MRVPNVCPPGERPHLLLDEVTGAPTHLYNGVCPDGNVYGQMKQKRHCFTLVQAINGTAGNTRSAHQL